MDTTLLNALTRDERSSLILALQFTAHFLGLPTAGAFTFPSEHGATPFYATDEQTNTPKLQKLRASIARQLFAPDLRKDLVDRAVYAVASGMTTKHDINRLVANAVRSAETNAKRGGGPTAAWLLFYTSLKNIYAASGVAFPKLQGELEPEPEALARRREEREALNERVQKVLNED